MSAAKTSAALFYLSCDIDPLDLPALVNIWWWLWL
jgi:hypothetical protein